MNRIIKRTDEIIIDNKMLNDLRLLKNMVGVKKKEEYLEDIYKLSESDYITYKKTYSKREES